MVCARNASSAFIVLQSVAHHAATAAKHIFSFTIPDCCLACHVRHCLLLLLPPPGQVANAVTVYVRRPGNPKKWRSQVTCMGKQVGCWEQLSHSKAVTFTG